MDRRVTKVAGLAVAADDLITDQFGKGFKVFCDDSSLERRGRGLVLKRGYHILADLGLLAVSALEDS